MKVGELKSNRRPDRIYFLLDKWVKDKLREGQNPSTLIRSVIFY